MISKKKILTGLVCILAAGLNIGGLQADNGCCFNNISVGADFLYWQPCAADTDYAVEYEGGDCFKTKYINSNWDPGFRAWIAVDDIFCGFDAAVIYTYFDTNKKDSTSTRDQDDLFLSTSLPVFTETPEGNYASGEWDLEYQTLSFVTSHPLQISCNRCISVEAFSGLTWLKLNEKRKDFLHGGEGENETDFRIHRDLDFWGIGPVLGMNTTYNFWDCIKVFGMMSTTLIVGENDAKDHFVGYDFNEDFDAHFKNDDECVCFPGFHFATGLAYEMSLCEIQIAFHVGWEYIHWVNAPSFPYYEKDESGVRSANSDKSLTLQGIFAGVNITF